MSSRNYVMTIFDFDLIDLIQKDPDFRFMAYGDEVCPTTNREHKQAYVVWKRKITPATVRKKGITCFFEMMKGNLLQNEMYCSKEGSYHKIGDEPMDQKEKGKKGAEYWEEQVELAKEDPDLCDPKLQITHGKNLDRIFDKAQAKRKVETLDNVCGVWIYGQAGSGKTTAARTTYPDAYIKDLTKWWDEYKGEDVVIMDDMDPFHKDLSKYLKDWADKWPFRAEMKGSSRKIRPKKFIVTSQYHYNEIFTDKETLEALDRRYTVVNANAGNFSC